MKILVGCLLLSLLGLTIASPSSSLFDEYKDLIKTLNGGSTTEQTSDKAAKGQYSTWDYYNKYYSGKNKAKEQSNDEVMALLDSLTTDQDFNESEDAKDIAFMQSLFKVIEKLKEENAKAMSSESERAQSNGLGNALWKTAKNYLTNKYCPKL